MDVMRARPIWICVLVLAGVIGQAAPAGAKPQPAARHCVVWISPVGVTGSSTVSTPTCFTSFRTAQHRARGAAPLSFARATGADVIAASTTISVDYDGANFSGTTLTWTVPNSSGCNGFTYSAASMPSGWSDRVSSSKSFAGCSLNRHFHDVNFLGSGIICTCATMGAMANQTSSERWAA
jgi:hypothetical protein